MTDEKKNPLGPVGEHVRSNVERLRDSRGMTKRELSEAVAALGRPIPPLGVSRVEAGGRRVDADDLVALALALNVSPLALLLPPEWGDEPVSLTPKVALTAQAAWLWGEGRAPANDWATGEGAVTAGGDGTDAAERDYFQQREDYEALTHPQERRRAAQHPANVTADTASAMIGRLVRAVESGDRAAAARQLKLTKNRIAQLQNEVEQIELELDDTGAGRA